jgi:hypothetical protein
MDPFYSIPYGNQMLFSNEEDEDMQLQLALNESLKLAEKPSKQEPDQERKTSPSTSTTTTSTTTATTGPVVHNTALRSSQDLNKPSRSMSNPRPDLRASTERKNSREKKRMPTIFPAEDFL